MLLMNLESRPIVFEDIGRQVLATGERKPPEYFISEIGINFSSFISVAPSQINIFHLIGKINEKDIHRVSQRMLGSKHSIAALGELGGLPTKDEIAHGLINGGMVKAEGKRFSLFR